MTIVYVIDNKLYLNITNKCNCACEFCVRKFQDGVGGSKLWLDYQPSYEEIIQELSQYTVSHYDQVVFCGYGEPTEALENLIQVSRYIKESHPKTSIRLNTNGLGSLANNYNIAPTLHNLIDVVSISLNAPTKESYYSLCHPKFGPDSFLALQEFAKECKKYVPVVLYSVVDILPPDSIAACQKLADDAQIHLRIRQSIQSTQ